MARMNIPSTTPTEFGGFGGLYANNDPAVVAANSGKPPFDQAEPMPPWKERMALTQTVSDDESSVPRLSDGGSRVA